MVTNAYETPEKAENLSPSSWESLYRAQDDLEALKYSYIYNRDDELRRSTGSIYGPESPTKSKPQPMHVRSNSDTSEINVLVGKDLTDGLVREPRSPTGESFFALIRKFEQNIQNEKHVSSGKRWYHESENQTYIDGFRGKSGASSASSSPLVERRTPLLKRKNSLRNNTYLLRVFKGSGETKVADDEYGDAPSRKYFAHYDCRSMAVDFEDLAQLYAKQGDGPRRKNTRSGASAASAKITAATMADKIQRRDSDSSTGNNDNGASDQGDNKSNDLVESCPYFRNELDDGEEQDPQIALTRGNMAFQNPHDPMRPKEPKLDIHKRRSTLDILLTAYDSARRGNLSSGTGVTILDNSKPEGGSLYLGEGFHNEDGRVFEHVDHGSYYYKNFFVGQEHLNYLGIDERFGPVALSLRREKLDERNSLLKTGETEGNQFQYRIIIRTSELTTLRGSILEEAIPSTSRHGAARALPAKDILEHVAPELQLTALRMAQPGVKVPEQLMKLDEQGMTNQYKVGVLYCKEGQSTEEQMYNNQTSGPAFDEFLDLIGTRITLKGFEGYRAQLDNRNDSTGECSVYTHFHGREIMFHVSTLLPWTPNNRQQLLRKRHIGNDIVTIVFQEPGAVPFTPKNIRSHFQHVFIVVRVFNPCSDNTYYRVAVSRSKDVPPFGPSIPAGAKFGKQKAFADFLLTKVINAENAAHKSEKFSAMATRTRHEYLKDLATNSVTNTTLETGAKGKGILRSKKKDKVHPPICAERVSRGALIWNVQVEDYRNSSMIECKMGTSADTMVLVHSSSKEVLFSIPTKSVIGWTPLSESIKVFYGSGDCLVLNVPMSSSDDIPEIVRRLEEVSIGCQTQTMTLRRNNAGQLGFHVQYEGLIADVEPSGYAWQAGLRQGCRLVEINGKIVATLNHDHMIDILRKPGSVSVVMVPPFQSGKPRKGIQPSSGSYWGYSRSSVATISSHSSASSVAEEQESRDHSAASSSTDSGWKQPPRMTSKNLTKGKDSPWIMRGSNTAPLDAGPAYSGSRPPDRPASPGASSASSVSGSSSTLHEAPGNHAATYGASYTVTTITPNEERQKYGSQEIYPTQSASSSDKPKWSGLITLDSEPRPSKSVGVTLTAHTASGTLYAIASGPSSPTPLTPETPIFGSTSQRPDARHRRAVMNGQEEKETVPWDGGVMPDEKSSTFRVNVEPMMSTSGDVEQRECGDSAAGSDEAKVCLPFKETSLGAVITTVNTYKQKQSLEDITDASMSETVDQIERAFGFKTPEMIGNGSGSLERNGSTRRKSGDRISLNSLQDIHLTKRTQSGDSLNVPRSSEDDEISGDILNRLSQEEKVYFRENKIQQRSSEGDIHRLRRDGAATVVDASPTAVEVKKEGTRKSEFEARMAARNLIIERLENHKQALDGDAVEGIKIYHAKSRSSPADTHKTAAGEKPSKGRQISQDDIQGRWKSSADRDGDEKHHHSRRRKPSDSSNKTRTPEFVQVAKPVVRSERKIRLSSSTTPLPPNGDKSQTVPRLKSTRRQRHVSKQMAAVAVGKSDSSEDESRPLPRQRVTRDSMDTSAVVTGKSRLSTDRNKKASSLPRELESGAKPLVSDSRSRRPHASHLKGARITKIKMSASEEPNDSIVDQTSRLLNASQAVRYDQGSSLVIAEDVLNSLTRASDLLHHQSSSREERDKDRREKDKSLSRIKAPGRGRSHGPHKFYIPVVPRRHSFDERIFALPSAKGNSGESLLTRESIGKEAELEMKLAIVSNALMKEGEEKHRMDSELRKLQKENRRLQEDLRTASQQLRKFTEWFFSSVEPNNS